MGAVGFDGDGLCFARSGHSGLCAGVRGYPGGVEPDHAANGEGEGRSKGGDGVEPDHAAKPRL